MKLAVGHTTRFHYDAPPHYALLQLRLEPQSGSTQTVLDWTVDLDGARRHTRFTDHHGTRVELIEPLPDATEIAITVSGRVETSGNTGVLGEHVGTAPLWLYRRATALTRPTPEIISLARDMPGTGLDRLHALSQHILGVVPYQTGTTAVGTTASDALALGRGVCQDHTHLFVSAARCLGVPARYVSGYLMMNDRVDQDASHAWAEAHVDGLGWVGFDVSNGIAPDQRYIRIACGLDYADCAPTRGLSLGGSKERLEVAIQVQQ